MESTKALEPEDFPERLVLRDTKIFADEGQRIFTTATGYGYTKCEYVRADLIAALASQGEAAQPAADGWREISEENGYPPMDTDVILGWWRTWPKPVWEMDLAHYGSERGRWTHGQATHWLPISILPASPGIASQAEKGSK